ncbi:MAG TPA: tRNA (adenosine(37)-N6)-threonylcarbamoyltransferase complex dimerization subunit type 1 TsaB [Thermotogota bacterium]|nr:tRNA (adenosine(37)-N6)-threonylcarbamoyltransferase complex dimerization subunit type 1 TsaB [Thermotogota bacterium]HPR96206.1 tRNA (adenosine(37)-N6)-threonylcarbamoyltransferase complex dimerization subunit type 1 TsaB [Thermotogota bacterium]
MKQMKNKKNLIVFIDSSTRCFYVAIKDTQTNACQVKIFTQKELKGEAVLSVVKGLFEEYGYTNENIEMLCTTSGPGSLTGLRICMSTLKTMAQVLNLPIVTLPTLFALEKSYTVDELTGFGNVYTILMARKNHYYIRERGQKKEAFLLLTTEEILRETDVRSFYLVEGQSAIEQFGDKSLIKFVNIELNPEKIMDLCYVDFKAGHARSYLECLPEYGGKSVAEINYEKRNKEI